MSASGGQNIFGRVASKVDHFFEDKFYKVGSWVGNRPGMSVGFSLVFLIACASGMSQLNEETRADKLWVPQGTRAQDDESAYTAHYSSQVRLASVMLESKDDNALDSAFLKQALQLHDGVEKLNFEGHNLTTLCVAQPFNGHPCLINSVLGTWNYSLATLEADSNPLATLNATGMRKADYSRLLGGGSFNGDTVQKAKAILISYIMQSNRELDGNAYVDPKGEGWEGEFLDYLGCDEPECSDDWCACDWKAPGGAAPEFRVYAQATRSFGDAFGSVIRGDIGLVNGAFMLMIVYLVLNLGGLCHKVNSRALLAVGCVLVIVMAGVSGYGIAMWMQFIYTPVHSVLPFVLIGIGVDDSFVIMNALDRTDITKPVPERIATAISKAGVSVMVTSITDFVAFTISVSSALPALSAFCMYAGVCILMLFIFQISVFTAFATWDARRVAANRIDCCFCLPKGCPCCPVVDKDEAMKKVEAGEKDPNQMLCCYELEHKGGRIGVCLEKYFAPQLVKLPVALVTAVVFAGFCGLCAWQATMLDVQDTTRSFIPDDSYFTSTLEKTDLYFAENGIGVNIMTGKGDYSSIQSQQAYWNIGPELDKLDFVLPSSGDSFANWAVSFKEACAAVPQAPALGRPLGGPTVTINSDGAATVSTEYYAGLKSWLDGPGARFQNDIRWVDESDPQKGLKAARVTAEISSVLVVKDGEAKPDAQKAVKAMDGLREACDNMKDLPGGRAIAYSYNFNIWETYKIIGREMYLSVGLCLGAVFIVITVFIGHPVTSISVTLCVVMTIIDILGCCRMWGLAIDSVVVIQLVISVGLAVDYAAHVGHNFMVQTGTNAERVVKTMGDVGAAVLLGACSTFLGVMLLAASQSYVFRVLFQCFFLTAVLGVAHGLIMLPALLFLIGPASYKTEESKVPGSNDVQEVKVEEAKAESS